MWFTKTAALASCATLASADYFIGSSLSSRGIPHSSIGHAMVDAGIVLSAAATVLSGINLLVRSCKAGGVFLAISGVLLLLAGIDGTVGSAFVEQEMSLSGGRSSALEAREMVACIASTFLGLVFIALGWLTTTGFTCKGCRSCRQAPEARNI